LVEGLSRESDRWDEIRTPAELLGLWERKNAEAVAANFLPGGMLHFNLLFKVR